MAIAKSIMNEKILVVNGALPGAEVLVMVNGKELLELKTYCEGKAKDLSEPIHIFLPKESNNVTVIVKQEGLLTFRTTFVTPRLRKYNSITTINTKEINL